MAAPAERIAHGSLATPVLSDVRRIRSLSALDEVELKYMCNAYGVMNPGDTPSGYSGLRIQEMTESNRAGDVEAVVRARGLISGSSKRLGLSWQEDPFGWDTVNEERVELTTAAFVWGAATLSGYANMRQMAKGEEDQLDSRWVKRSITHRGIKTVGLAHRRVTNNGNIVQPGGPIEIELPGGWPGEFRKANISMPRVVCIEIIKSTVRPNFREIPGPHSGLPASGIPFPAVKTFVIDGPEITYNWPSGWTLQNLEAEELFAGVNLWLSTYTYEYVWQKQF
jgi:hypothetical protein